MATVADPTHHKQEDNDARLTQIQEDYPQQDLPHFTVSISLLPSSFFSLSLASPTILELQHDHSTKRTRFVTIKR